MPNLWHYVLADADIATLRTIGEHLDELTPGDLEQYARLVDAAGIGDTTIWDRLYATSRADLSTRVQWAHNRARDLDDVRQILTGPAGSDWEPVRVVHAARQYLTVRRDWDNTRDEVWRVLFEQVTDPRSYEFLHTLLHRPSSLDGVPTVDAAPEALIDVFAEQVAGHAATLPDTDRLFTHLWVAELVARHGCGDTVIATAFNGAVRADTSTGTAESHGPIDAIIDHLSNGNCADIAVEELIETLVDLYPLPLLAAKHAILNNTFRHHGDNAAHAVDRLIDPVIAIDDTWKRAADIVAACASRQPPGVAQVANAARIRYSRMAAVETLAANPRVDAAELLHDVEQRSWNMSASILAGYRQRSELATDEILDVIAELGSSDPGFVAYLAGSAANPDELWARWACVDGADVSERLNRIDDYRALTDATIAQLPSKPLLSNGWQLSHRTEERIGSWVRRHIDPGSISIAGELVGELTLGELAAQVAAVRAA